MGYRVAVVGATGNVGREMLAILETERPWIELVQLPPAGPRDFGGKVRAINAGYDRVRELDYGFIGNLDADVSFESEYFEFLLYRYAEHPDHGLMGTIYIDIGK